MDVKALEHSPLGALVPISGDDPRWGPFEYFAFMPAPLPDQVPLSEGTYGILADAALELGRLDASADRIPNPRLLVGPTLKKEAVSTSALEGTFAPLAEVLEGELAAVEDVSESAREVINYVRAAERGIDLLRERPVSLNLLCPLQEILVEGTRGDAYDKGRLRQRLVVIGTERRPIHEARFVPPPHDRLPDAVSAWEKWIHRDDPTLLVRIALGHYQFEALHPFSDGNGRLGRLVVALQLMEGGTLRYPLLNISEWLEPRKDEYKDGLLNLSISGDFDAWVSFFCRGVRDQARVAHRRIDRLIALRNAYIERVRSVPGSRGGTALRLAEDLIGFPVFDVPWVAREHGVSYPSANEAIKRLVELGMVRQIDVKRGRTRKLFVAHEVMHVLEA